MNILQQSVVKYLSMVYVGISMNCAPLVTVFLSYLMVGEKLKKMDMLMILVTFVGVTLISIGFKSTNLAIEIPISAYIGCFLLPFLMSFGNVLMHQMKGLHENAVSIYISTGGNRFV